MEWISPAFGLRIRFASAARPAERGHARLDDTIGESTKEKGRRSAGLSLRGGHDWDRTSDPCDVNTVLYR